MYNLTEARVLEIVDQAIEKNKTIRLIKMTQDTQTSAIIRLENRMDRVEDRLGRLESRMDKLENRMDKLESRMDKLENRMQALDDRTHKLGIMIEDIQSNLRFLIERLTPFMDHSAKAKEFEESLKSNEDDIKITQKVLKSHVENKSIHRET